MSECEHEWGKVYHPFGLTSSSAASCVKCGVVIWMTPGGKFPLPKGTELVQVQIPQGDSNE